MKRDLSELIHHFKVRVLESMDKHGELLERSNKYEEITKVIDDIINWDYNTLKRIVYEYSDNVELIKSDGVFRINDIKNGNSNILCFQTINIDNIWILFIIDQLANSNVKVDEVIKNLHKYREDLNIEALYEFMQKYENQMKGDTLLFDAFVTQLNAIKEYNTQKKKKEMDIPLKRIIKENINHSEIEIFKFLLTIKYSIDSCVYNEYISYLLENNNEMNYAFSQEDYINLNLIFKEIVEEDNNNNEEISVSNLIRNIRDNMKKVLKMLNIDPNIFKLNPEKKGSKFIIKKSIKDEMREFIRVSDNKNYDIEVILDDYIEASEDFEKEIRVLYTVVNLLFEIIHKNFEKDKVNEIIKGMSTSSKNNYFKAIFIINKKIFKENKYEKMKKLIRSLENNSLENNSLENNKIEIRNKERIRKELKENDFYQEFLMDEKKIIDYILK